MQAVAIAEAGREGRPKQLIHHYPCEIHGRELSQQWMWAVFFFVFFRSLGLNEIGT